MATMNISLSDPMKDWVDAQMETGRYDTVSEYVRDLIRHDQDRTAKIAEMQEMVTAALASGESNLSLAEVRRLARARSTG